MQHFSADLDECVLAGDIKLKKLDPKDVWKIKKYESGYTGPIDPQNTQLALQKIHSYKTPSPHDWSVPSKEEVEKQNIIDQLHSVVTALRIYKEGDLMIPLTHFYVPLDYDRVPSSIGVSYPPILSTRNPYTLTPKEVEDFPDFWKTIHEKGFPKRLEIAARRFDSLYERRNSEDNIIDCIIGLEALFGTKERIRSMIALKTAFLVGNNREEIKEIYTFLTKSYDLRSKIVHGDKVKFPLKINEIEFKNLNEVVFKTQKLLRLVIKRHLHGELPKQIKESFKTIELLELKDGKDIIDRVFEIQET